MPGAGEEREFVFHGDGVSVWEDGGSPGDGWWGRLGGLMPLNYTMKMVKTSILCYVCLTTINKAVRANKARCVCGRVQSGPGGLLQMGGRASGRGDSGQT